MRIIVPVPAHLRYWLFRLTAALHWYLRASTRYDVHSPFLSSFVHEVYTDDRHYYVFDLVPQLRRYWEGRSEMIPLQSLGAPSRTTTRTQRTAASLVRSSAISDRSGRLLFRLAVWLRPERIIEFGTNAGISTVYLHAADTRTPLLTVEGNPAVAALATDTLQRAGAIQAVKAASSYVSGLAPSAHRPPPLPPTGLPRRRPPLPTHPGLCGAIAPAGYG